MTSERMARSLATCIFAFAVTALGCKSEPEPAVADKAIEAAVDDPWLEALGSEDGGEAVIVDTASGAPSAALEPAIEAPGLAGETEGPAEAEAELAAHDLDQGDDAAPAPTASGAAPTGGAAAPAEAPADDPGDAPADDLAEPPAPAPSEDSQAPAPEPEPAAPAPITLADFAGSYSYVGGASQREDLEQAIEAAAESLPAIIRGIGRKRLTKTNQLDTSIDIAIAGDQITATYTSGFSPTATVGGGQVTWTSKKGDKYRVRFQLKGTKLIQVSASEDGVKTTVFVLSADRKRLTVHHKVSSDRLPEAMTYRLTYSRR